MVTLLLLLILLVRHVDSITYGTIDYSCSQTSSWMQGSTTYNSAFGKVTDIINVTYDSSNSQFIVGYWGIPNYDHPFDSTDMSSLATHLTNKPTDFKNMMTGTTAVLGTTYAFGADIGYSLNGCNGYWPIGPSCPGTGWKTSSVSLIPRPEGNTNKCYALSGKQGTWVNGVYMYVWGDGSTYNSAGVWSQLALEFEKYALDVCLGHAAGAKGLYHHHSYSRCLKRQLQDDGTKHSPIYGWVDDGYPIYGPYQSSGVLAKSCWTKRDYSSATTGCSDGKRSCIFVDEYDYTKGTTTATSTGPDPSGTTTSTTVTISAASGIYYQDYYYNSTCGNLGGVHLNSYNGHDHDNLGFHYHVTIDESENLVFPYVAGPKFYGCLPSSKSCCTKINADNTCKTSTTSTCSTTTQGVALSSAQCTSGASTFTMTPTTVPTVTPTITPTTSPSLAAGQTYKPTTRTPTYRPTTARPTTTPTNEPTATPSYGPSYMPSKKPSPNTEYPTFTPTNVPTNAPSSVVPTAVSTQIPSRTPTVTPTKVPTVTPTSVPSTLVPTYASGEPTPFPTTAPPTVTPSEIPTEIPTVSPSETPTTATPSTASPTITPTTSTPSTSTPSFSPSDTSAVNPTYSPTFDPNFAVVKTSLTVSGWPHATADPTARSVILNYLLDIIDIDITNVTVSIVSQPLNRRSLSTADRHIEPRILTTSWVIEATFYFYTAVGTGSDLAITLDNTCTKGVDITDFIANLDTACGCLDYLLITTVTCKNKVLYDAMGQPAGGDSSNASLALIALLVLGVIPCCYYYYYYKHHKKEARPKVYSTDAECNNDFASYINTIATPTETELPA